MDSYPLFVSPLLCVQCCFVLLSLISLLFRSFSPSLCVCAKKIPSHKQYNMIKMSMIELANGERECERASEKLPSLHTNHYENSHKPSAYHWSLKHKRKHSTVSRSVALIVLLWWEFRFRVEFHFRMLNEWMLCALFLSLASSLNEQREYHLSTTTIVWTFPLIQISLNGLIVNFNELPYLFKR